MSTFYIDVHIILFNGFTSYLVRKLEMNLSCLKMRFPLFTKCMQTTYCCDFEVCCCRIITKKKKFKYGDPRPPIQNFLSITKEEEGRCFSVDGMSWG
jgi:hypothetical protein